MYYPSRISQLLEEPEQDLNSISELAAYYKELYTILSMQAMRQVDSVRMQVKNIMLSDLVDTTEDVPLLGDPDMMKYLFTILHRQAGQQGLKVSAKESAGQYVEVDVLMAGLMLDDRQCLDLFSPSIDHLPYLLCRQIIRDLGEATNARGCGMIATPSEEGVLLTLTLVRGKKQS